MFLSVIDLFRIGIGPSSSHTMGPMFAAATYLNELKCRFKQSPKTVLPIRIRVSLHGSLAYTGKGHATDRAVILGLMGYTPENLKSENTDKLVLDTYNSKKVIIPKWGAFDFDPNLDLIFDFGDPLPGHPNGIIFSAIFEDENVYFQKPIILSAVDSW